MGGFWIVILWLSLWWDMEKVKTKQKKTAHTGGSISCPMFKCYLSTGWNKHTASLLHCKPE